MKKTQKWMVVGAAVVACFAAGLYATLAAPGTEGAAAASEEAEAVKWAPAVEPKPLTENVNRGIAFLLKTQHKSGGWAQGEESTQMGHSQDNLRDKPNVADTCVATLALIRAGSTPSKGPHAAAIRNALGFICSQIEEADGKSLFITSIRGTRVQMKLGTYVDTFLAAMVLAEAKDQMPDAAGNTRILAALDKTMDKIERNQQKDGTWDNRGWAPTLTQGMASKALNRAAQSGYTVSEQVRGKAETYARKRFDKSNGGFDKAGSAGVQLYADAAGLGAMQDSDNTNGTLRAELEATARSAKPSAARAEARQALDRHRENAEDLKTVRQNIVKKVDDPNFIRGFGSNGGEEFLSYMNIGESLVVKNDDAWTKWDTQISANLNRIQNKDGSWTGHHCITGRTFCTSAALLCLTVDRAPVPVAGKIRKR